MNGGGVVSMSEFEVGVGVGVKVMGVKVEPKVGAAIDGQGGDGEDD